MSAPSVPARPEGPRRPARRDRVITAWRRSWRNAVVMLIEHFPFVVGAGLVSAVHMARSVLVPNNGEAWTRILDAFLVLVEVFLLIGIVVPKGMAVLLDLAEQTTVGIFRVRRAWQTGMTHRQQQAESGGDP